MTSKAARMPDHLQAWITARKRHHRSRAHVQIAVNWLELVLAEPPRRPYDAIGDNLSLSDRNHTPRGVPARTAQECAKFQLEVS
jgi:hypothetical protein